MQNKVFKYIEKLYKNGNCEYILCKYVKKDFWLECFKSSFKGMYIEDFTDFNYSKCFTLYINSTNEEVKIGTESFKQYVLKHGVLDMVQVQISAVAPFACIRYVRYKNDNGRVDFIDSYKPFDEYNQTCLYDNIKKLLLNNNISILDKEILLSQVPYLSLELRESNPTVYQFIFEDEC